MHCLVIASRRQSVLRVAGKLHMRLASRDTQRYTGDRRKSLHIHITRNKGDVLHRRVTEAAKKQLQPPNKTHGAEGVNVSAYVVSCGRSWNCACT
eukprot:6206638-Pleurochrysis_carterae.AAC.1